MNLEFKQEDLFAHEDRPKRRKRKPRRVESIPVDNLPLPRPAPPARTVNRLLSEVCGAKLRKIITGSPKLSPSAVVRGALQRGEWIEVVIENGSTYGTVEIVPNYDYKAPAHSKVLCGGCVWMNVCGLDPAHVDCDYDKED